MNQEKKESLIKFPCVFPIKVMGATSPNFAQAIGEAVKKVIPQFSSDSIRQTQSSKGNYTALSLNVPARNQEELDMVYRMLTSHPAVKVVL